MYRLIRRPLFSAITAVVPHCKRASHAFLNTQYASVSSNRELRLVEEALDRVENERLTQDVGTTAVMAANRELVDGLVDNYRNQLEKRCIDHW